MKLPQFVVMVAIVLASSNGAIAQQPTPPGAIVPASRKGRSAHHLARCALARIRKRAHRSCAGTFSRQRPELLCDEP